MFTYKFLGLTKDDAPTRYYYGTVPANPEIGHVLRFDETGNRYTVVAIEGKGLTGPASEAQRELAWADINRGEKVPTLVLKKLREPEPERYRYATREHRRDAGRVLHKHATRELREDVIREHRKATKQEPRKEEMPVHGRSFDAAEVKEWSRTNRKIRLSGKKPRRR
jgi:hypothetical protein